MKKSRKSQQNHPSAAYPDIAALLAVAERGGRLKKGLSPQPTKTSHRQRPTDSKQQAYIQIIEEQLRLATLRKFAASSEKCPGKVTSLMKRNWNKPCSIWKRTCQRRTRLFRARKHGTGFLWQPAPGKVFLTLNDEEKAERSKRFSRRWRKSWNLSRLWWKCWNTGRKSRLRTRGRRIDRRGSTPCSSFG